ncbi:MAG: TrkA family potassium uptake protein [Chloroflexi bacterium]|nr:TrkA family potassium uptake protein [Chloroflexota bacterium]
MTEKHHPEKKPQDNIIIVGCGRVGAELALSIARQNHQVTIVDVNTRSFDRLGPDFRGRTVQGEAIDEDVLKRAGIESAHGFVAATTSDSVNFVAARAARDIFHVEHVVARVYNPRRAQIYERLGIQTVTSSSWGAQRLEQLILHSGLKSVFSAGSGEVQLYEFSVPQEWEGRSLESLIAGANAVPVALTRGGRASLPGLEVVLKTQDVVNLAATAEGAMLLESRLRAKGEK